MKSTRLLTLLGILLGGTTLGHATVIGFGNLGGSNTTVPSSLGSNAMADGNGYVVSNGATPNIAVTWQSNWDIHTSPQFAALESMTVGGGAWDNEGDEPRVAQLDEGSHTIGFTSEAGFGLLLNSFDFGQTAESAGVSTWDLTLTDSALATVWSQSVTLDNLDGTVSSIFTIAPAFVGVAGESYTLSFNRTSATGPADGRVAIDNLSFNQIPEPSSVFLLGFAGVACLARRRK